MNAPQKNAMDTVAEFVQSPSLAELPPALFDRVKLHLLDTLGALLAGSRTPEGIAIGRLLDSDKGAGGVEVPGYPFTVDLATAVMVSCAAARLSEVDDIHLASCTTPGSVIIPAALALASAGELSTFGEFAAAVTAGYEMLIRLGLAVNGPAILQKKMWPTYFAAAFGSAATASRAWGLSAEQTAGALATALASATGTAISGRSPATSRWLTLGAAASSGVRAARSARQGFLGDSDLLERYAGRIAGLRVSTKRLLGGLGRRYRFDEIGTKPYPVARQALAAVEAARELVQAERLDVAAMEEIVVRVPGAQLGIINHPEVPGHRLASIISAQYQIALALLAPERLFDTRRTPPFADGPLRELMAKVRVERAPELEKHYPARWPGEVAVKANGRWLSRQVLEPQGDARNRFDWDGAVRKFQTIAGPVLGSGEADRVASLVRSLDAAAGMPALWQMHAPVNPFSVRQGQEISMTKSQILNNSQ